MKPIENSTLKDWSCTKRINGLIRLKERRLIYAENWNYEESGAKTQIEPDDKELMN